MSLPVRGAWVEIGGGGVDAGSAWSLPVRGAWVEIRQAIAVFSASMSRSPCGERGLKYTTSLLRGHMKAGSLPVRGAWVEMHSSPSDVRP